MRKIGWLTAFLFASSLSCLGQDSTWTLIWSDEFNNPPLDTNFWSYDTGIGDHGWGNSELQYYTMGENISFKDSCLVIELRKQTVGGTEYTSSRITTRKKVAFQYGKIQARIRAPYSQAVWPAFWTLGADFNPPASVPWPACGEIDIFEMACGDNYPDNRGDNTNFGVVHYTDLTKPAEQINGVSVAGRMADNFHIFTLVWDEQFLSFFFDSSSTPYLQVDITKPYMDEFHQPHSLTVDMALGGIGFAGSPDATTVLPQHLSVDWIRWYQKKTGIVTQQMRPKKDLCLVFGKTGFGISFTIAVPSKSSLQIFDCKGRPVADLGTLIRQMSPGVHKLLWGQLRVSHGMYVISFNNGLSTATTKAVIPR